MTEAMQCTGGGDDPASTSKPMDGASTASSSQSDQQQPLSSSSPFSSSPSRPLRTPPPDEQYVHVVHFLELLVQCFVQKVPPACEHKVSASAAQRSRACRYAPCVRCSSSSAQVLLSAQCASFPSAPHPTPLPHTSLHAHKQAYLEWLQTGKQLWLHMLMDCPCTGDCAVPGCQNARAVLQHRLTCQVRVPLALEGAVLACYHQVAAACASSE